MKKSSSHFEVVSRIRGIPMSTLMSLVEQPVANFFSTSAAYHPSNFSRIKCLQGQLTETSMGWLNDAVFAGATTSTKSRLLNSVRISLLFCLLKVSQITIAFSELCNPISLFTFSTYGAMIFVAKSLIVSVLELWVT